MKKTLLVLISAGSLAACSYHSPLENYSGPVATLSDSTKRISNSKVEYYVPEAINGSLIENSLTRLQNKSISSGGRGQRQDIILFDRPIPASKTLNIAVAGTIKRPRSLENSRFDNRDISGTLTFTPEAGKHYVVTGKLDQSYRGIWIAEADSGEAVSNRVEISNDLEPAGSDR